MSEWRKCSVCKKSIELGADYYVCSITSCRKSSFCSVECWDVHNGVMSHKSAGAIDAKAPTHVDETLSPRKYIVTTATSDLVSPQKELVNKEILIVASKFKDYVRDLHGLNTSANVFEKLSDIVRKCADDAASQAKAEGRKTLMDRDFYEN